MERFLQQQQDPILNDALIQWYQLQKNCKSNRKLKIWAFSEEMWAPTLRDWNNAYKYSLKINKNVDNLNLSANQRIRTSMTLMIEQINYLEQGIPINDDWRYYTQFVKDMFHTKGVTLPKDIATMRAYQTGLQKQNDLEIAVRFSDLDTKSMTCSLKYIGKCQKTFDSGRESESGNLRMGIHITTQVEEIVRNATHVNRWNTFKHTVQASPEW